MKELTEKEMKDVLNEAFKEALERFPSGKFSSVDDNNRALSLLQFFYFSIERRLNLAGLEKWDFDTNKIYLEKGEGSDNKINERLKHHENLLKGGIYDTA